MTNQNQQQSKRAKAEQKQAFERMEIDENE
jgi:hypothetical protein